MLASVSDDGSLDLWDTNGRRNIHTFSEVHKAPATGLKYIRLSQLQNGYLCPLSLLEGYVQLLYWKI